jgi:hypothetical protein
VIQDSLLKDIPKAAIIGFGFLVIFLGIILCVCCAFKKSRTYSSFLCCLGNANGKQQNGGKQRPEIGYTSLAPTSKFPATPSFPRAQLNNAFDGHPHTHQNGGTTYAKLSASQMPPTAALTRNGGFNTVTYGSTANIHTTTSSTGPTMMLTERDGGGTMVRSVVSLRGDSANSIPMRQMGTSSLVGVDPSR